MVVSRFSYPRVCWISVSQGTNLSPMYCKADSEPLDYQGSDILEPCSPYFIQGLNLALAEVSPEGALTPPYSSVVPMWIGTPSEWSTHRSNRVREEARGTWPGLEGTGIGTCLQGKGVRNTGATSLQLLFLQSTSSSNPVYLGRPALQFFCLPSAMKLVKTHRLCYTESVRSTGFKNQQMLTINLWQKGQEHTMGKTVS